MLKNWENKFSDEILERGYDYYICGHVGRPIKTNEGYEAFVRGRDEYQVLIEIKDQEIVGMSCDCPCDFHCKHEAALLYALEGEIDFVDKEIKNDDIDELISNIPVTELTEVIKEACLNNYNLYQSLSIKYNSQLSDNQKSVLFNELYNINQCEYDYFYDDDLYIDYVDGLESFIRNKIGALINSNKLDFGYKLLKEAVNEAIKYDVDEWDYWVDGLFDSIYDQLVNLYTHGSKQFKQDLLVDLKKHLEYRIFSNVIERFLIDYVQDRSFQNSRLEELDEMIKDDECGYCVLERIDLMKVMGFSQDEMEEVLDKYYDKPDVRGYLIERHLQNNRQLEAIDVMEDSIEMDGDSRDYGMRLIKLYRANNMLDKWAPLAYQSLVSNSYGVDHCLYNELKDYYGNEKWQELKGEVYSKARGYQLYEYYVLDDEHQKLFDAIKNESIDIINKYENYLKKYYSQELLVIYRDYVVRMGEGAKNRSAYDRIEYYLNKMLNYSGGKEVVGRIKSEWINRFPTRTMMIKRLEKIVC